jgi:hypothetical protein
MQAACSTNQAMFQLGQTPQRRRCARHQRGERPQQPQRAQHLAGHHQPPARMAVGPQAEADGRQQQRQRLRGGQRAEFAGTGTGATRFALDSSSLLPSPRCSRSIRRKPQGGGGYAVNLGGDARSGRTWSCASPRR